MRCYLILLVAMAIATPSAAQDSATTPDPQSVPAQDAPQEEEPPTRTGFRALVRAAGSDVLAFPRRESTWWILGIGATAAGLGHLEDDYVNAHIVGSDAIGTFFGPGKWIGSPWVQGGSWLGVYLVGRYMIPATADQRANKVSHIGLDLLRAQMLSQALIHSMKYAVRRDRPTGECCSFPSGHAAATFAAASVVERHFGGNRITWPTMLAGTYVAASRLHNNRHFVSDVTFGAAIGIASAWTVVGRHGRAGIALTPVPVRGGTLISVAWVNDSSRPD